MMPRENFTRRQAILGSSILRNLSASDRMSDAMPEIFLVRLVSAWLRVPTIWS
jgi:hypothetical protein